MLYFSKLRITFIFLVSLLFILFATSNIFKFSNDLLNKKINLGLDLQGGSYLLLEINSDPLVKEKIQSKVIPLKKILKENNIDYSDFLISEKDLTFQSNNVEKFELLFFSKKDNVVNSYLDNYRSFELD